MDMECESSMDMSQGADSFADIGAHSPAPPASSASFAASASVSFSASASSASSSPAPASFSHAATASASPLSQLDGLRRLVHSHVSDRAYQSAIFFASSLVSLSGGAPDDVYLVAETHFAAGAYKRAIHVLRQHDLMGSPDVHRALLQLPSQERLASDLVQDARQGSVRLLETQGLLSGPSEGLLTNDVAEPALASQLREGLTERGRLEGYAHAAPRIGG